MRFAHVQENADMVLLIVPLHYSYYKRTWKHKPSKLETRDSTKHSLGPTKRRKQQTMKPELWSKPLLFFPCQESNLLLYCISFVQELSLVFTTAPLHHVVCVLSAPLGMVWPEPKTLKTGYREVSVRVSVGLASTPSKHAKHSCTPKTAPKPCLKLMPCLHHLNMDYILGVSVLGGPLSVMKVW